MIQINYKGFVLHQWNAINTMTISHFQVTLSYTPAYHQQPAGKKTELQVANTSIYGHNDYGSSKEC